MKRITKAWYDLMCRIGLHKGFERNGVPFQRECPHCHTKWYGTEVESGGYRTVGDFRTEESLRRTGEWRGK